MFPFSVLLVVTNVEFATAMENIRLHEWRESDELTTSDLELLHH